MSVPKRRNESFYKRIRIFQKHLHEAPRAHQTPPLKAELQTSVPSIVKFSGLTNANQFIEDLEAKFILQPIYRSTNRQKVMIAVKNSEGSSPDGSNKAPKEWARLEIELSPELRDD
ncbi:hypothetical protein K3495_g10651 [Podosphaera aphanis]|nr:hypothetical protein K3495_g10651 [Podosphaera aphanis]